MKNFLQNNKNIIITIIIFVIGFYVFKYFKNTTSPTESLDTSVVSAGKDVVDLSNSIKTATLNNSLFSIPAYKALQDFSTEIMSQPMGRTNPFSPIGSESVQQVVTPAPSTSTKK